MNLHRITIISLLDRHFGGRAVSLRVENLPLYSAKRIRACDVSTFNKFQRVSRQVARKHLERMWGISEIIDIMRSFATYKGHK